MNLLIRKLEEYYKENGLDVVLEEKQNCLHIKQRILTADGFVNLEILAQADKMDYRKCRFSCYGLGALKNVKDKDLFKIKTFNEMQEEVQLCLDENDDVFLTFEREFLKITPYDLGIDTMEEALKCVSMFARFIKSNYPLLKQVVKCLK